MSIQVANINLAAAVVGTTGAIKFGAATPPPTITQQMRPQSAPGYVLLIQNESGCGLTCTFPLTSKSLSIRAGDGRTVNVPPGEVELDYIVSYVLPNAPVSSLLADLYIPGEAVDAIGALGNSPIGVSGITTLSTKIPINTTGGDIVAIEIGPDVAAPHDDWEFLVKQTSGFLQLFDNLGSDPVWQTSLASPASFFQVMRHLKLDKSVQTVGGEVTDAGSAVGVAPIVARVRSFPVNATGSNTIFTYTPANNGLYRLSAYMRVNNSVSGQLILFSVTWTELDTSSVTTSNLVTNGVQINGTVSVTNGSYAMDVMSVLAKAGGNTISFTYNDPGGVPADRISIVIERID